MSPRPGGEADKFGNRYEGAWTVRQALNVLYGLGSQLVVEPLNETGDGVEFTYTRSDDGVVEAHQAKRSSGTANYWTIPILTAMNIWTKARFHVEAAREYYFVSLSPAGVLADLCDRARRSNNLEEFKQHSLTNDDLRDAFTDLSGEAVFGSPEVAWSVIRGMWFEVHDERDVIRQNAALSIPMLSGANGHLASIGLGDIILNNLAVELDLGAIESRLATYGLTRVQASQLDDFKTAIEQATERWRSAIGRELLEPPIERLEANQLFEHAFSDPDVRVEIVVGRGGGGKSAVLAEAVDKLIAQGVPVLAFRLDRLDTFSSTEQLGQLVGVSASPVSALAAAARGADCVLVIDQLDAVSLASGRVPENFDAVADLISEALVVPHLRVILACRQFDVDNDHRIRRLQSAVKATTLDVAQLNQRRR